ncbi:hypothetical protein P3T37_000979 [Kitasatospora sp. MAA4]|uniref:hypothetical protein n=1 Tax=Kitasatospora sp. MAA4 TaxID=3035093 RepID=UPI002474F11A|nr:hypothetical protein [Kitasatospora sp. MAA4]MDH6131605.1 hypothetical protein [Kitasatospora sp. MAA4]
MVTVHKLAGELPAQRVEEAKGRAATLLLAFRHGNQLAFDDALDRILADHSEREVVTLLVWIAAEAVRKAYAPEVGDKVLRTLARRAPAGPIGVAVDEESADAARLIEAVQCGEVLTVRELVAATADTTFLLGGLLQGVAMMLPLLPEEDVREVVAELRARQAGVPAELVGTP